MAESYQRDKNGVRLDLLGGLNTVLSPDLMEKGYPYLQNCRRLLQGRTVARPPLGDNALGVALPDNPTSLIRMNDPPPPNGKGPVSGYVLVIGAAGKMYVNATQVVTGLSGNPLSFVPFRPNTSPQPWCYVADSSLAATITSPAFNCTGMVKVRSDNVVRKTGIAEPQAAPVVATTGGGGPNWVIYRYVYRASETGAMSNPSPESVPQTVAQSSQSGLVLGSQFATKLTFNASQYEYVSAFRTRGGVAPGTVTDYVVAHNFGLTVPVNMKIDGVQIALNWAGQNAGTGVLSGAALYYQGAAIGQIKSPAVQNVQFVGTSGTTVTQGGNSDSWGTVLTPAIVNDNTFGFGVQITTQSSGGSDRSFLYTFQVTVYFTDLSAGVHGFGSSDPQVDKIDFYRMDPALANFTYVGTVPNDTTVFTDKLNDLEIAANPLLQFDNFEPFPSIDLPHKGVVTVAANGVVGLASGDPFNVRWLPGTVILINGIAYELYNRPTSTVALIAVTIATDSTTGYITIGFPPTGVNQSYEISEPSLAAQPSPVIWGPTPENAGSFYFGLDPLNPGDLLWSKGNNFDSAPDTNRLFVTSPSEALMNGTITSELSTVFSTERFWLIYPNFADAFAAVTGTQGQQWTLIQSSATRGLYMRYAINALGAMIAYRAKDCIAISIGGGPEQSITDDIYNLFPHGGSIPQPVTIAGNTVYPPDDTKPKAQTIVVSPGYIFYDYQDTNGNPRTLVYDIEAKGWSVDAYTPGVNCHLWAVGANQLLTGCTDGTVRALTDTGGEVGTAILGTRSENGGEARALKRIGDVFIKALVNASNPITVALYQTRFTIAMNGFSPTTLTGSGSLLPYTVDFTSGYGDDVDDVAALFSWPLGSGNVLDLWQPDWTGLPETIQDRPSDWTDCDIPGNKLIRGMVIEMDSFNAAKAIQVETSDTQTLVNPFQMPVTVNGQTLVPFTFTPFTAHMLRVVSTDGVPWRLWGARWIADPWPDYTPLDSAWSNLGTDGAKYLRGLVIPMDTNGQPATFRILTSDGDAVVYGATTLAAQKTPVAFAFTPPIVAHEVQIQCQSNAALWTEEVEWIFDPYPEIIPAYTPIMEIGGPGAKYMRGVTITGDSANASVGLQVQYDGGQTGPLLTARFNGKQTQAFAFTPPFVAHDVQIIPLAPIRIWTELASSNWHYDSYPELTPEYTPIMEISGPDNKFVQGLKIVGDSGGVPVQFRILYDGGQVGPLLEPRTFNGKQTQVYSLNPPLIAHDLQLVPQSACRVWLGADESKWIFEPYAEMATTWATEASTLGLYGWNHIYQINLAYISTQPVTLTVTTDQGTFVLTYPASSNGPTMPSKILLKAPRNKWKVVSFTVTSSVQMSVWKELCEIWVKPWGSTGEYQKINPFGSVTTAGAAI